MPDTSKRRCNRNTVIASVCRPLSELDITLQADLLTPRKHGG